MLSCITNNIFPKNKHWCTQDTGFYVTSWQVMYPYISFIINCTLYNVNKLNVHFLYTRHFFLFLWWLMHYYMNLSCALNLISTFWWNYLAFQHFGFERTLWRFFQKRVVRTKFDIYFFITTTGSIPKSPRVSSSQYSVLRHWHGLVDIYITDIYSS